MSAAYLLSSCCIGTNHNPVFHSFIAVVQMSPTQPPSTKITCPVIYPETIDEDITTVWFATSTPLKPSSHEMLIDRRAADNMVVLLDGRLDDQREGKPKNGINARLQLDHENVSQITSRPTNSVRTSIV